MQTQSIVHIITVASGFCPAVMFMISDSPSENSHSLQELLSSQGKKKKIPLFKLQMSWKNITQGRELRVSGSLTLLTPN